MPNILVMTVGLPRSGKSTWARSTQMPIVSPDAVRKAMHGQDYLSRTEPLVWGVARTMVHSLFGAGHEVVILDACSHTVARRNDWRSQSWQRVFYPLCTDAAECKRRATADCREDLLLVIERMEAAYEGLTGQELAESSANLFACEELMNAAWNVGR